MTNVSENNNVCTNVKAAAFKVNNLSLRKYHNRMLLKRLLGNNNNYNEQ